MCGLLKAFHFHGVCVVYACVRVGTDVCADVCACQRGRVGVGLKMNLKLIELSNTTREGGCSAVQNDIIYNIHIYNRLYNSTSSTIY